MTVRDPRTRDDIERGEGSSFGLLVSGAASFPASIPARIRASIAAHPLTRERIARWLLPADSGGAGEIRALDGVRAIAALSIVAFHILLHLHVEYLPLSRAIGNVWYYLSMGVPLFFVLSGFLLFRPYARAMLSGAALPSWTRFYQRRALRILPVYWVALAVMLLALWTVANRPLWLNALAHVTLLHDDFPRFNRDLDGPFWTLAVEVQFYLLLPVVAAGIARVVRGTRSAARLLGALLGVIALAEALRWLDTRLMASVTPDALAHGGGEAARFILGLATMGMQGKSLEIFFVGALCATVYVIATEREGLGRRLQRRAARGLLLAALLISLVAAPAWQLSTALFTPGAQWGAAIILYPLVVGVSFGALTLGAVWGGPVVRAIFAAPPLRFIGLISYSLYVWHAPILRGDLPIFAPLPLWLRVVCAFVVAYLSYQLLERPFLRRRQRLHQSAAERAPSQRSQQDASAAPPMR
ncbi:MAG TPA: acyltransferase [Ktedonobacterales bacterium]|nr:acyltransferase [Ktedonobacterales bacterium]